MNADFHTTRWTLVLAAGEGAERALGDLCTQYRSPLVAHARRRGLAVSDAEDAVQGFFERLLRLESLATLQRGQGKFRAFMLGAFNYYLSDRRDAALAAKRGGGRVDQLDTLAWSTTADATTPAPDAAFDRAWALALLTTTMDKLRAEHLDAGRADWFEALVPCLAGRNDEAPQAEIAQQLGISEPALRVAVHRLRKRYRELLRAEVAQTVADPNEIDAELRHLITAVRSA